MNKETILIAVIAFLVGGIGGYAVSGHRYYDNNDGWWGGGMMGMHRYDADDGYRGVSRTSTGEGSRYGMGGGGQFGMMNMMVTSEQDFITQMIPHHQEAVDTAKEVLARGATTPEIKTLVEGIITAQEKEIADMKQWYEAWYGTPYQTTGTYHPMMRELDTLSGATLDKAFLEDMIMHHMGAIMMAQSVQPYIKHQEVTDLTQAIVRTQSLEISQMREMLAGL